MSPNKQKLSIIFMNDTGETRRFRVSAWCIKLFACFVLFLLIIAVLSTYVAIDFWKKTASFEKEKIFFEQELTKTNSQLERLQHLQSLANANLQPALIQRSNPIASEETEKKIEENQNLSQSSIEEHMHPIKDIRFRLDNVQALFVSQDNSLRINVDLVNVDSSNILSGLLTFSLLFPDGTVQSLNTEKPSFRIRRYKKVTDVNILGKETGGKLENCRLIAEIHVDDTLTLREYYPISLQ